MTCCVDGGIAIHNPRRQHLPIKMMHLEFPPEYVFVAFTQLLQAVREGSLDFVSDYTGAGLTEPGSSSAPGETSLNASRFAVMGDYGNNVNVYDSRTLIVQH